MEIVFDKNRYFVGILHKTKEEKSFIENQCSIKNGSSEKVVMQN
jgi:hypothetical protein